VSRRLLPLILVCVLLCGCGHASTHGNGPWVVFTSDRDGRWDVYAVHPDRTGLIRVTSRRTAMSPHLATSPDGHWLAIVAGSRSLVVDRDGRRHLRRGGDAYAKATIDDNGKVGQLRAEGGSLPSPDGKYAVVVDDRGEFRVAPARGGPARRIARGATGPAWSPDGHWLAFSLPAGGPSYEPILDLAVARPDASDLHRVTRSIEGEGSSDASWSPDGRHLVFARGHSSRVGRFDLDQIWLVDRDGAHSRALTHAYPLGGDNDEPVWFDGVLHVVPAPPVTRPVHEGRRIVLRTRYPVGEVRIRAGRIALVPMTHSPQTPQPSAPLVFWSLATGKTVARSISACAEPEGLLFDGKNAVFDCNNSCCDSTDESLRMYSANAPAPVEIAAADGGGPTRDFLGGYGLDGGVVVYARGHVRRERVDRMWLTQFDHGRGRVLPGPAGTVFAYGGGRIALGRKGALDIADWRGARLYTVPGVATAGSVDVFGAQPRRPQVRLDAQVLVVLDRGVLRTWNAQTGARLRAWPMPHGARLEALSQGRALVVAGRVVHVVRLADGHDTAFRFPQASRTDPAKPGPFYGFYADNLLAADLDGRTLVVSYDVGPVKEPGRVVVLRVG
jgi:hypothetical protein